MCMVSCVPLVATMRCSHSLCSRCECESVGSSTRVAVVRNVIRIIHGLIHIRDMHVMLIHISLRVCTVVRIVCG
jgi:hypothetical protein